MKYKVSNVCQLYNKSVARLPWVESGITVSVDGNSVVFNGTATSNVWVYFSMHSSPIIGGHKYYFGDLPYIEGNDNRFSFYLSYTSGESIVWLTDNELKKIFVPLKSGNVYFISRVLKGMICNNFKITPQLFDLTEMYGAGNEPTTVEEFRKDFPDEYYEYSPKCFETIHKLYYVNEAGKYLTMNRGKFVTETKNLFDVGNSITYAFNDDNASNNNLYVKNGLYYTAYNNYDIGSGLRIKDGLALPAGTYTLSVEVVDCYNIDFLNIGFRYKGSSGEWFYPAWRFTEYKFGGRISMSFNITKTTDLRLYINYQNNNGITFTGFVKYKNIQLEQGSTATDYQPYKHIAFN